MENEVKNKKGRFIPWLIVLFFVVLACADGFFVYLALSTHPGVRVENSYEKGVNYNDTLAEYATQKELGINAKLEFESKNKNVNIKFFMLDKDNKPLDGYIVSAKISRPTQKGHDQNIQLNNTTNGLYSYSTELPFEGLWDVFILAEKNGNIFRMTKRIDID